MEKVILVNKKDEEIGVEEKIKTHQVGKLHRAFSIFLFNKKGELLLQKRASFKYHSGGLWTNTCCSHPRPGENLISAAKRRLKEEMGIKCELKEVFTFTYKAQVGNLTEHEFDHIFFGFFEGTPKPDKKEVEEWRWIKIENLKKEIKKNPQHYTVWFKKILRSRNFQKLIKNVFK